MSHDPVSLATELKAAKEERDSFRREYQISLDRNTMLRSRIQDLEGQLQKADAQRLDLSDTVLRLLRQHMTEEDLLTVTHDVDKKGAPGLSRPTNANMLRPLPKKTNLPGLTAVAVAQKGTRETTRSRGIIESSSTSVDKLNQEVASLKLGSKRKASEMV